MTRPSGRQTFSFVTFTRVRSCICMFPLSEFYVVWQVLCTEVDDDARELFFAAGGFIMDFIKITPLQFVRLAVFWSRSSVCGSWCHWNLSSRCVVLPDRQSYSRSHRYLHVPVVAYVRCLAGHLH